VHGISNVSLVQPPTRISKPVSPRKALVLFLGLCVALSGGIGIPLLLESLDNSLRTAEEVEQQLQLPVLISMPHASRSSLLISRTSPLHDSPIHNS
jgi:capsular polysaccharide biosynthesis protein